MICNGLWTSPGAEIAVTFRVPVYLYFSSCDRYWRSGPCNVLCNSFNSRAQSWWVPSKHFTTWAKRTDPQGLTSFYEKTLDKHPVLQVNINSPNLPQVGERLTRGALDLPPINATGASTRSRNRLLHSNLLTPATRATRRTVQKTNHPSSPTESSAVLLKTQWLLVDCTVMCCPLCPVYSCIVLLRIVLCSHCCEVFLAFFNVSTLV